MTVRISYIITEPDGAERSVSFKGRDAWALDELIDAGDIGATPIERVGPRWSAYIFKLRRAGLNIETITEAHDGPFKGTHARYVLRSSVRRITPALLEAA